MRKMKVGLPNGTRLDFDSAIPPNPHWLKFWTVSNIIFSPLSCPPPLVFTIITMLWLQCFFFQLFPGYIWMSNLWSRWLPMLLHRVCSCMSQRTRLQVSEMCRCAFFILENCLKRVYKMVDIGPCGRLMGLFGEGVTNAHLLNYLLSCILYMPGGGGNVDERSRILWGRWPKMFGDLWFKSLYIKKQFFFLIALCPQRLNLWIIWFL